MASLAAAGTWLWAFEDIRRAMHGQKTMTDEAISYWRKKGFVGGMKEFGQALKDLF